MTNENETGVVYLTKDNVWKTNISIAECEGSKKPIMISLRSSYDNTISSITINLSYEEWNTFRDTVANFMTGCEEHHYAESMQANIAEQHEDDALPYDPYSNYKDEYKDREGA